MVKKIFIGLFFFSSCYTETLKPDYEFMNRIKQQASLDPSFKTRLELKPAKYFFGNKANSDSLSGSFAIRNIGTKPFHAVSIKSNCDCVKVSYQPAIILPDDSLTINYEIDIKNRNGLISSTIVVIGNCQFGNQTFYMEGTILNK